MRWFESPARTEAKRGEDAANGGWDLAIEVRRSISSAMSNAAGSSHEVWCDCEGQFEAKDFENREDAVRPTIESVYI